MIRIYRKPNWILNPNDKVVNTILKRCEKCDGLCPCTHDSEDYEGKDLHCPCTDYIMKDKCECGLYVKDETKLEKGINKIKCNACGTIVEYTDKDITYGFLYPESIRCPKCDALIVIKDLPNDEVL